jgi:endonuclease YncB( thermonuclease family)
MSRPMFARRSRDTAPRWSRLLSKSAARSLRFSTDPFTVPLRKWRRLADGVADRPALETASPESASRRWDVELGILFHLACVGVVATVIIAVFFGTGLYSLARPTAELVSWLHNGGAPAGSTGEMPSNAGLAPVSPASVGGLAAAARHGSTVTVRGEAAQPGATTQALGAPSEPLPEPTEARGSASLDPKRLRNASTELVTGTAAEAVDAMTWVVDDQIVRLWGIRPGPRNRYFSLSDLVDIVRAKGPVNCHKRPHSGRYQCFTATQEDIVEALLSAGLGRAAGGSRAYRDAEAQARREGKGIWAKS